MIFSKRCSTATSGNVPLRRAASAIVQEQHTIRLSAPLCSPRVARGTYHAGLTWGRSPEPAVSPPRHKPPLRGRPKGPEEPRSLLIVARPSPETDDLLAPLLMRADLCLVRVATLAAAEIVLRDVAVKLVLVCPDTPADVVTAILDRTDELRPGPPVLALRDRSGEHPLSWRGRTIAVLRAPVLPAVLDRTVDVALGLIGQGAPARQ